MVIPTPEVPEAPAGPEASRRLRGVALWVRDLGASLPFYCTYLGLQLQAMLDLPGAEVQRATVAGSTSAPARSVAPRPFLLELLCPVAWEDTQDTQAAAAEAEELPGKSAPATDGLPGHLALVVHSVAGVVERLRQDGHGAQVVDAEAAVFGVRSPLPSGHRTQQVRQGCWVCAVVAALVPFLRPRDPEALLRA